MSLNPLNSNKMETINPADIHSNAEDMLSVLLLCDDNPAHANTILDHISALTNRSRHRVYVYNPRGMSNSRFLDLDEFDVVVIHYSIFIISDYYLALEFRERLRRFEGLKIQFIQDDYRWVDKIAAMMRHLGINILFTLVPADEIPKIWDEIRLPNVLKINTLPGYVPERLVGIETMPLEIRPIDIGYRGRILPYWLGRISQEKAWIGQGVLERAERYGIRCDIAWSEDDRIYGRQWDKFLGSCRATLGTESGATITDFDGSIELRVKEYLAEHPNADFWEVSSEFLETYEGNVRMNVISPRMFEAIAKCTALILFAGDYSGILEPWEHYIPLERSFSNMADVVEKLRDTAFLRRMTERAYQHVIASHDFSYTVLIEQFDGFVTEFGNRGVKSLSKELKLGYRIARLENKASKLASGFLSKARLILLFVSMLRNALVTPILRSVLVQYLKDNRGIKLSHLAKDLLLVSIVKRIQTRGVYLDEPYSILTNFVSDERTIVLMSLKENNQGSNRLECETSGTDRERDLASWHLVEAALRGGGITKMIWDHSAIGESIQYRTSMVLNTRIYLEHRLGSGLHSFESLVKLAGRLWR